MSRFPVPALTAFLSLLAVLLVACPSHAWIETAVRSHETTVTLLPNGRAAVRHDLVLRIRGSKVKALDIEGVGETVELLPDATARSATQGSGSQWPLSLSATEDGALRLAIHSDRGIGGGTYRFDFGYQIDLLSRGLIESAGADYAVSFIGPRLSTGVDSAKVIFRVPRASVAPRLDDSLDGPSAGVLLGQLRRGAELDDIELTRAHVAQREPAVWRIIVPRDALSGVQLGEPSGASARRLTVAQRKLAQTFLPVSQLGLVGGLGVLFGLLTFLRSRFSRDQARRVDALPRPFLPGGPLLRAVLGGFGVILAGVLVLLHRPVWAIAPAALSLAAATHLLAVRKVRARGPGHWERVADAACALPRHRGEDWFEAGTVRGFTLFAFLMGGVLLGSFRLLPIDNYLSMMSIIYGLLFLPLFWTGRRRDLPLMPVEQSTGVLSWVRRGLDASVVQIELWGRRPVGETPSQAFDETRLRLLPTRAPKGLRAVEVAFEEGPGAFVMPCVIVRLLDGSDAQRCLPEDISWTRGRDADERVAILRPTAPTPAQLLRLLKSLLQNLRADPAARVSHKAAKSGASGLSASKRRPDGAIPAM